MTTMKKAKCDIKMRQHMPTFAETGSCFDATNIAGIKVSIMFVMTKKGTHAYSPCLVLLSPDLAGMMRFQ